MTEPRILGESEVAVPIDLINMAVYKLRNSGYEIGADELEALIPPKPSAHDEAVEIMAEAMRAVWLSATARPAWPNYATAVLDALTPDLLRRLADHKENDND